MRAFQQQNIHRYTAICISKEPLKNALCRTHNIWIYLQCLQWEQNSYAFSKDLNALEIWRNLLLNNLYVHIVSEFLVAKRISFQWLELRAYYRTIANIVHPLNSLRFKKKICRFINKLRNYVVLHSILYLNACSWKYSWKSQLHNNDDSDALKMNCLQFNIQYTSQRHDLYFVER